MSKIEKPMNLDRELRLQRLLTLVLGAAILFIAVSGQGQTTPAPELVGRSLTLVDQNGRVWLTARSTESGGELRIISGGKSAGPPPGIALIAEESQKYVSVFDGRELPLVDVGVSDHRPTIRLARSDLSISAVVSEHADGHGCMVVFDGQGNALWAAPKATRLDASREGDEETPSKDK